MNIGSVLWNCHICYKIMLCIFCGNVVEIRKMLLKVTLDKIGELRSMAIPLKDGCRPERSCVCFSI